MSKKIFSLALLVLLVSTSEVLANPVTINDTLPGPLTYAIQYNGSDPRGGTLTPGDFVDIIGPHIFRTDYARATFDSQAATLTLVFHTNFPAGGTTVNGQSVRPADIFLSTNHNPGWDFGIVTSAHDNYRVGDLINQPSYQTSEDLWESRTWYYYAGRYTTADPGDLPVGEVIPVKITGGGSSGNASVSWLSSTGLSYDLTVVLGLKI